MVSLNGLSGGAEDAEKEPGIVVKLTEKLMQDFTFKTMNDDEVIYYYDADKGIYIPSGKTLIKEQAELLAPEISTHLITEITQKIRRRTFVDREAFDSSTDIVNVQNRLLDIQTGELHNHSPEFLSTIQLPVKFDHKAKCPNILKFLGQVLRPQDVFTALKLFGYILYRTAKFEKAFLLNGNGDNGKGVFIKLVEAFTGSNNCSHVSLQDLDKDRFSAAELYDKLVNTFADLKSEKLTATGSFKTMVSGDSVYAQRKYGQPFSFRNHSKLIYSTNKIPDSEDKSYAYYKRWVILMFDKVFQGASKDTDLINKLTTPEELSGLLNLALIALKQLKKDGAFKDISVEKIRREYEHGANTVKAFLDEKCVIDLTAPEYYISTVHLYNEYWNFCRDKGTRPLEINIFGAKLKEQGIEKERLRSHGDRDYYYFGVKLKSELRGQNQSLI